jgi:hypothetical protein
LWPPDVAAMAMPAATTPTPIAINMVLSNAICAALTPAGFPGLKGAVVLPAKAFEVKRAVAKMAETNKRMKPPLGMVAKAARLG